MKYFLDDFTQESSSISVKFRVSSMVSHDLWMQGKEIEGRDIFGRSAIFGRSSMGLVAILILVEVFVSSNLA